MADEQTQSLMYSCSLHAPEATTVAVAGDFNGWQPAPLERGPRGIWRGRLPPLERMPFTPVQVRYKFVIDGETWIRDPDNPLEVAGDSVLELPPMSPLADVARGWSGEIRIFSRSLGREMPCFVHLPPGYDDDARRYPTIYLLHGYHDGGASDFLVKGRVDLLSDVLAAAGHIPPMILVMPEGEGSFYADRFDGGAPFERYMVQDLIDAIDARYRTLARRSGRGIGGLSMGGYGAAKLALQYPDRFRAVGSHAGLYDVRDAAFLTEVFGPWSSSAGHRRWNSPIALIEEPERTRDLALYFDCGDQDHLLGSALKFQAALSARGIPHRFDRGPGFHAWDFVQRRLPSSLSWFGRALDPAS
jgi:S-formylglutathione hydrolase FrmB